MIFVLIIIIKLAKINNGSGGLLVGLLGWIGFVVPMEMGELVCEKYKSKKQNIIKATNKEDKLAIDEIIENTISYGYFLKNFAEKNSNYQNPGS